MGGVSGKGRGQGKSRKAKSASKGRDRGAPGAKRGASASASSPAASSAGSGGRANRKRKEEAALMRPEDTDIPPNQTVEVGSIWDMRDVEMDPGCELPAGLFEVKKIVNDLAYNGENEAETLQMDLADLAKNFRKLTEAEVKKIRHQAREYHKSTIQPIKCPNGKVIQVGSTWDIKKDDGSHLYFTVASLSQPSANYEGAVWSGEECDGWGKSAKELYEKGVEIPLDKLPEAYSEYKKQQLQKEVEALLKEGKDVCVEEDLNDGKLVGWSTSTITARNQKKPKVMYIEKELTAEAKALERHKYKEFLDWVASERALAAERDFKLLTKNELSMPLARRSEEIIKYEIPELEGTKESPRRRHQSNLREERMRS